MYVLRIIIGSINIDMHINKETEKQENHVLMTSEGMFILQDMISLCMKILNNYIDENNRDNDRQRKEGRRINDMFYNDEALEQERIQEEIELARQGRKIMRDEGGEFVIEMTEKEKRAFREAQSKIQQEEINKEINKQIQKIKERAESEKVKKEKDEDLLALEQWWRTQKKYLDGQIKRPWGSKDYFTGESYEYERPTLNEFIKIFHRGTINVMDRIDFMNIHKKKDLDPWR